VLSVNGKKIALSIKQALPPRVQPQDNQPKFNRPDNRVAPGPSKRDRQPFVAKKPDSPSTLDDKIAKFLKESDERMQPLKNKIETRRRNKYN